MKKGEKILKNPKAKKWGYLGVGALGGTLAVYGIDSAVKKAKEKKKRISNLSPIFQRVDDLGKMLWKMKRREKNDKESSH